MGTTRTFEKRVTENYEVAPRNVLAMASGDKRHGVASPVGKNLLSGHEPTVGARDGGGGALSAGP